MTFVVGAGQSQRPKVMPERLGKYELLAPLAQGGTAEVFLARLSGAGGFEKVVVVKRLLDHLVEDREFVGMFLDEARLGARLDQSNIVQTIELGCVDGQYFIAMEYLAGLSIQQLGKQAQQRAGGLPVELTLALAVQACTGLHYAHEATQADGTPLRLVHRDVSPQNLIVTYDGVLKIVDFGIAHAAQEAREARTRAGFIKGKFAYMSPEQCLGHPFDRRTDVFALAIVVHELLTGQRLFKRETTYKTYQAIVNGEVTRPSKVNPRLDAAIDRVLLKALAPRAEDRHATAEEFGEDLEALLHRSGRHGSAGEIARYITRHFGDDIDEQQRTLSALLTSDGTNRTTQPFLRWDDESDDSASARPEDDETGDERDHDAAAPAAVAAVAARTPGRSPPRETLAARGANLARAASEADSEEELDFDHAEELSAVDMIDATLARVGGGQAEASATAAAAAASASAITGPMPNPRRQPLVDVGAEDKTAAMRSSGAVAVLVSGPAATTLPVRRPPAPSARLASATPTPQLLAEGTKPLPQLGRATPIGSQVVTSAAPARRLRSEPLVVEAPVFPLWLYPVAIVVMILVGIVLALATGSL
jgi:serine/threonine-protein kinase